jgi:hypothetical protein
MSVHDNVIGFRAMLTRRIAHDEPIRAVLTLGDKMLIEIRSGCHPFAGIGEKSTSSLTRYLENCRNTCYLSKRILLPGIITEKPTSKSLVFLHARRNGGKIKA